MLWEVGGFFMIELDKYKSELPDLEAAINDIEVSL
jgi:hypothetical protein